MNLKIPLVTKTLASLGVGNGVRLVLSCKSEIPAIIIPMTTNAKPTYWMESGIGIEKIGMK